MKLLITIVIIISTFSYNYGQNDNERNHGWQQVYAHDKSGNPVSGNIDTLMEGLRKGFSVKVGWGWSGPLGDSTLTLEHFALPVYVTILQNKVVSVIIEPHPLLENYLKFEGYRFKDPAQVWQAVLTTEGKFNAMVYSRNSGELIRDWPQRHRMIWYLEYP